MFRPNLDAGSLLNTKIKADTKLTVVMKCQIFDRKSVAPSSDIFYRQRELPVCGQDQTFNNFCLKWLVRQLRQSIMNFGTRLPKEIFNICPPMCRGW